MPLEPIRLLVGICKKKKEKDISEALEMSRLQQRAFFLNLKGTQSAYVGSFISDTFLS